MYIGRNVKAAVKLLEAAGGDYALLRRGLSAANQDPRTGEIRFSDALASIRALRTDDASAMARPEPARQAG